MAFLIGGKQERERERLYWKEETNGVKKVLVVSIHWVES